VKVDTINFYEDIHATLLHDLINLGEEFLPQDTDGPLVANLENFIIIGELMIGFWK
jgi:hypothetical protein